MICLRARHLPQNLDLRKAVTLLSQPWSKGGGSPPPAPPQHCAWPESFVCIEPFTVVPPHRTGLAPPVPPPLLQAIQLDFRSFPTCPGLECDGRGCGWYCSPEVASSVPLYLLPPSQAFLLFSLLPLLNPAALYGHIKLAKIPCYPQKKSHVSVRGRLPPNPALFPVTSSYNHQLSWCLYCSHSSRIPAS